MHERRAHPGSQDHMEWSARDGPAEATEPLWKVRNEAVAVERLLPETGEGGAGSLGDDLRME